jgi:hypothetical protein
MIFMESPGPFFIFSCRAYMSMHSSAFYSLEYSMSCVTVANPDFKSPPSLRVSEILQEGTHATQKEMS